MNNGFCNFDYWFAGTAAFWTVAITIIFAMSIIHGQWIWGALSACWLFLYMPFQIMRYIKLRRQTGSEDS